MIGRTQLSTAEHDEEFHEQFVAQNAAEQTEIRCVVDEIDNTCDAKDWAACCALFADEIEVDFTDLAGGEPGKITADDLIESWRTNLFAAKKTFHQRSNHSVEIDGDNAEVVSKAYAFNLLESGEVAGLWEVWAHYTHTLRKTASGWKCTKMTLKVVHQRGDEKVRTYVPK